MPSFACDAKHLPVFLSRSTEGFDNVNHHDQVSSETAIALPASSLTASALTFDVHFQMCGCLVCYFLCFSCGLLGSGHERVLSEMQVCSWQAFWRCCTAALT